MKIKSAVKAIGAEIKVIWTGLKLDWSLMSNADKEMSLILAFFVWLTMGVFFVAVPAVTASYFIFLTFFLIWIGIPISLIFILLVKTLRGIAVWCRETIKKQER